MRKVAIIILSIAILLIVGCTTPGEGKQVNIEPFIGGTQGLDIQFEANTPPTETFDGGFSPFDIVLRIENKGEHKVKKESTQVEITGIRAQEFNLLGEDLIKQLDEDLDAVRKDQGGTIIPSNPLFVEYQDLNHITFIDAGSIPFTLAADVCYEYGTKAVSKLCVRKNILNPDANGLCELNEDKPTFNSGAPVHITRLRQNARSTEKIGFSFDLQHVGTGAVYEPSSTCDSSLRRYQDRVLVRVETKMSGLSCSGLDEKSGGVAEGFASIIGGTKTITCTQKVPKQDFEAPITIKLTYDYANRIDTQIVVKSSGENQ
jgi:hypothetical protein